MTRKASKSGTWKICSEFNRRKDADSDGITKCCSCGKEAHWRTFDCGHFIPRSRGKAVFWEPENLHAQCQGCNCFDKERGKIGYTLYMEDRYGRETVDELIAKSKTIYREKQADLEYWNNYYKKSIKKLNT